MARSKKIEAIRVWNEKSKGVIKDVAAELYKIVTSNGTVIAWWGKNASGLYAPKEAAEAAVAEMNAVGQGPLLRAVPKSWKNVGKDVAPVPVTKKQEQLTQQHKPHSGMCDLSNPVCCAYIDKLAAQDDVAPVPVKKEKKCPRCHGTGAIQVAQGAAGIIPCPRCRGTAQVSDKFSGQTTEKSGEERITDELAPVPLARDASSGPQASWYNSRKVGDFVTLASDQKLYKVVQRTCRPFSDCRYSLKSVESGGTVQVSDVYAIRKPILRELFPEI